MALVIGVITPHPPLLIPKIGKGYLKGVKATSSAMDQMAEAIQEADPDLLVMISPHSPIINGAFAIRMAPSFSGSFADFGRADIGFEVEGDRDFAEALAKEAERNDLGVVSLEGGSFEISFPLDHGILVPLHFIFKKLKKPLVSVSISNLCLADHFRLGEVISALSKTSSRKIALIASGDLSHRLSRSSFDFFDPRGEEFDLKIKDLVSKSDLGEVMNLDPILIEAAGECGLRPLAVLAGAFSLLDYKAKLLSYEGPFGVGYLVATISPSDSIDKKIPDLGPATLARAAVESFIREGKVLRGALDKSNPLFTKRGGVFVSLKKGGTLRGCMGTFLATKKNLAEEIVENAILAASSDPRFPPLSESELAMIDYSVDILSNPAPVEDVGLLDPKIHGVLVESFGRRGLLLPDLEGIENTSDQIEIAKSKAGIRGDEKYELFSFTVERHKEK